MHTFVKLIWNCAFLIAFSALLVSAQESQYDRLIGQADALAKKADYAGALAAAQQAIRLNGDDFRGYYYAAFALYRQGLLSQAEPFAKRALELAPAAHKPDAQEMVDAVRNAGSYQADIQQGDQAIQNGQTAVAAEAYTKAWEARRSDQKTGIKAARLWGDKLNEYGKANRILQYIVDHPGDPDTLATAQELLNQYKPMMSNNYNERILAGSQAISSGNWQQAKSAFEDAVTLDPDGYLAHLDLARVYAHARDDAGAIRELKAAAKDPNAASTAVVSFVTEQNMQDFLPLFGSQDFVQAIREGFGPAAARKIEEAYASAMQRWQALKEAAFHKLAGRWKPKGDSGVGEVYVQLNGSSLTASGQFSTNQKLYASGPKDRTITTMQGSISSVDEQLFPRGMWTCLGYWWPETSLGSPLIQHCLVLSGKFTVTADPKVRTKASAIVTIGGDNLPLVTPNEPFNTMTLRIPGADIAIDFARSTP